MKRLLVSVFSVLTVFCFSNACCYAGAIPQFNTIAEKPKCSAVSDDSVDYEFCKAIEDGSKEKVFDYLNKMLEETPRRDSDIYYYTSIYLQTIGQHEDAIEGFTQALKGQPSNIYIYVYRASSYIQAGRYKDAINDYNKILSFKPTNEVKKFIYCLQAYMYFEDKDYKSALKNLKKAEKIDKNDRMVYEMYSVVYVYLKDFDEALESAKKAVALPYDEDSLCTNEELQQLIDALEELLEFIGK